MEVELIDRLSESQVEQLHGLYQGEWWSRGRSLDEVRRMLTNTPWVCGLIPHGETRLIAFARVLTDLTFRAILFDVIIDPAFRGRGLGDRLIRHVLENPRLASVQTIELYCRPELTGYYRRFGFTDELGDLRFMRLSRPDKRTR